MYTPVSSLAKWGILVSTAASAAANLAPRATTAATTTASEAKVTAITGCHLHASDLLVSLLSDTVPLTRD